MPGKLTIITLLWLALVIALAGGCGLKGDLYLPEPEVAAAPEDDDDENKENSQATDITDADTASDDL